MRIGLIVPGFSASEDDWCIPALLNSVRKLAENHDVHVFTLRYPHHTQTYQVYGATVHPFNGQQKRGWTRLRLILQCSRAIQREHKQKPFDVLHALWVEEPSLIASLVGRWLNIPLVTSLMGGELVGLAEIGYGYQLGWLMRGIISFSLKRAPVLTVGSAELAKALPQVHQAKTNRVPLGVDLDLFQPASPHFTPLSSFTGHYNLVHAGSLIPIKNQTMLLEAVHLARNEIEGIQLHILGEGVLAHDLKVRAASLNLDVVWHGAVEHDDLPRYYQSADLALLTSFFESQSLVVLEAGACGTPTVGTAVGILPELVEGDYLVEPTQAERLAQIMVCLLKDADLREKLGASIQQKVHEDYTLHQQIEQWLGLYEKAIMQNEQKGLKSP